MFVGDDIETLLYDEGLLQVCEARQAQRDLELRLKLETHPTTASYQNHIVNTAASPSNDEPCSQADFYLAEEEDAFGLISSVPTGSAPPPPPITMNTLTSPHLPFPRAADHDMDYEEDGDWDGQVDPEMPALEYIYDTSLPTIQLSLVAPTFLQNVSYCVSQAPTTPDSLDLEVGARLARLL